MNRVIRDRSAATLRASSVYFLVCGLSAIFWPQSWYIVAGINPIQAELILAVTGAMMLGLAVGAHLATSDRAARKSMLLLLISANAADFFVVFFGILRSQLPAINGMIFLAIDLLWCILLASVFFNPNIGSKNGTST